MERESKWKDCDKAGELEGFDEKSNEKYCKRRGLQHFASAVP
jgi:hypothetical protein